MPEGDTIFRTAATLRRALEGAEVTGVSTTVGQVRALGPQRLVGQVVGAVEPRGKHLLVWFAPSDLALHSHMRMSGSWHLYRHGERWRKPARLARVVLDVADWRAVCYSAPVVALLDRRQVAAHPGLAGLGPDALDDDTDLDEAARRLERAGRTAIGEALLDQRILAGVGNVYRCEILFIHGLDPWTSVADLDAGTRREVLVTAERLLKDNIASGSPRRVTTGAFEGPGDRLFVYGKARRPCPRCQTPIAVARQGSQARVTFWCPRCQGPGPR